MLTSLRIACGLAVLFVGLGASACLRANAFVCADSSQCLHSSGDGVCEASGYCSFPDLACPSGSRYGEYAGDGLADQCVGGDDPGTTGATTGDGDGMTSGATRTSFSGGTGPTTGGSTTPTQDSGTTSDSPPTSTGATTSGSPGTSSGTGSGSSGNTTTTTAPDTTTATGCPGGCGPCETCSGSTCMPKGQGSRCDDDPNNECRECNGARSCVNVVDTTECDNSSCRHCQSGNCTSKPSGTLCQGTCGTCSFGNCTQDDSQCNEPCETCSFFTYTCAPANEGQDCGTTCAGSCGGTQRTCSSGNCVPSNINCDCTNYCCGDDVCQDICIAGQGCAANVEEVCVLPQMCIDGLNACF